MNPKLQKLAAALLRMASDEFSNHGCNDMDQSVFSDWTEEEKQQTAKAFSEWNGDPENETPFAWISDSAWMHYCAALLEPKK